MTARRWVVLGIARPRSGWFGELTRWSAGGSLPVEFIKCLTVEELRARLQAGRAHSAILVDAGVPGFDRDLVDLAVTQGCAVIAVDDGRVRRDWRSIGVAGVLPATFTPADLILALETVAPELEDPGLHHHHADGPSGPPGHRAPLVTVCGAGGAGTSTIAMLTAQGLAHGDDRDEVALIDACLNADLAMYHDIADVIPGLPELVDLHRAGVPPMAEIRGLLYEIDDRGYRLLLGLRRHEDWTALRPRALEAGIDGLRRSHRLVVADTDADLEGEEATGSRDVEDRNRLARTLVGRADVVVAVGGPGVWGLHRLVGTLAAATTLHPGVPVIPVCNRAPTGPRRRAEFSSALDRLTDGLPGRSNVTNPVFIGRRNALEDGHLHAEPLPGRAARSLAAAVRAVVPTDPATAAAAAMVPPRAPVEEFAR